MALFRNIKIQNKFDNETTFSKVRDKYFDWILQRDVYFILGTESRWNRFLIVSIFYPPKVSDNV